MSRDPGTFILVCCPTAVYHENSSISAAPGMSLPPACVLRSPPFRPETRQCFNRWVLASSPAPALLGTDAIHVICALRLALCQSTPLGCALSLYVKAKEARLGGRSLPFSAEANCPGDSSYDERRLNALAPDLNTEPRRLSAWINEPPDLSWIKPSEGRDDPELAAREVRGYSR